MSLVWLFLFNYQHYAYAQLNTFRLHNEKLNDLYSSPNIVRVIKSRRDGLGMWRVWVSRGGCIESWWGNRREGDQWGDLGVDGWKILGWICGERAGYRFLVVKLRE